VKFKGKEEKRKIRRERTMRGIRNSEESIVIKESKNRRKVKIRRGKNVERRRENGKEEKKEGQI